MTATVPLPTGTPCEPEPANNTPEVRIEIRAAEIAAEGGYAAEACACAEEESGWNAHWYAHWCEDHKIYLGWEPLCNDAQLAGYLAREIRCHEEQP